MHSSAYGILAQNGLKKYFFFHRKPYQCVAGYEQLSLPQKSVEIRPFLREYETILLNIFFPILHFFVF